MIEKQAMRERREMKTRHRFISRVTDQRGITAIVVAMVMVLLIGMTALAVDIGYVLATKNELQNVADAAALAATRQLGAIYQTMTYEEQQAYVCDPATILAIAQDVADKNQASGTIAVNDVKIGVWDGVARSFSETLNQPDAVQVRAAREGANAITTFFARIFGIGSFDVWADATAALTGKSEEHPGKVKLPIGISDYFFENPEGGEEDPAYCKKNIVFHPSNDPSSCGGWTTFARKPSNDRTIRRILEGEITNDLILAKNTYFEFTGGDLSVQTFNELLTLYQHDEDAYDVSDEGIRLADGAPDSEKVAIVDKNGNQLEYPDGELRWERHWSTGILVYDGDGYCNNQNQEKLIEGFAQVEITKLLGPPDYPNRYVEGHLVCDLIDSDDSRGSGTYFGVYGSIPGLVE